MGVAAIDSHAHVMRRQATFVAERHSEPERDVSADDFIRVLDAHGVSHAVLTAPSFLGADNTLLLEALALYPERLRGTAIVAPDSSPALLTGLARQGVVGLRLNWTRRAALPELDTPAYRRLFGVARELDWHVEVFLEDAPLAHILPRILAHGVRVVLDHFGAPDPVARLRGPGFNAVLRAMANGRAWVKLSAPYRLGGAPPQPYVDALLAAGGAERLMWGSDFPWVGQEQFGGKTDNNAGAGGQAYQECLDWLTSWVPDARIRQTILATTPARLFGFSAQDTEGGRQDGKSHL